jgi:molecular chaperone GrpE (heat shock protein)/exonuclease VII small subunit
VSAPLEAYSQAIRETETAATAEWEQLRGVLAEALGKLQTNEQPSLVGADAERQRQATAYRAFFDGLVPLEQSLTGEVERLQETDAFQQAPQPLKDALLNYKKGIEIIHRMVKRLQDRKKPMDTAAASVPDAPALPEAAPDLEQWPAVLTAHCTAVHDWRTARSDAARNAQKAADAAKRETLAAVKNLLGALDGIESGQRSEPELLSRLSDHHADHGALIDAWFGTYDRIEELLKPFFAATGLEPMVIEPGTIFAPDTMEPGGTVADPSRKNEEVATMLRRGFKFAGENIRPALVEVVVNTNSG